MSYLDIASLVRDFVVTVAAGIGAWVAWRGIAPWRQRHHYDVAFKVSTSVYRVRNAMDDFRNPYVAASEQPRPPEDKAEHMNEENIRFYGLEGAYIARWNKVANEFATLNSNLAESEALGGGDLKELCAPVENLARDLLKSMYSYLAANKPGTTEDTFRRSDKEIFWPEYGDKPDEFSKKLKSSIEEINQYLKPMLS